ncbi:MSHA biogenesis protein MshK [Janthinobacterium sp. CG_23.3]|uniref:MSHA biogenesis protein MshK n=1 Tax=Janthinobacterium sp. CG_23.3 TaxID=3349634 RepID=UPI0038D4DDF5
MDRAVSARRPALRFGLACGLSLVLGGAPVAAQSLFDPTRPPAALTAPSDGALGVPGAPMLQSVLVSRNPGGRAVAVISGQTVRLGGKVGDAVLVRISQTEVVLRRGKALETLRLYPSKVNDGAGPAKP